MKRCLVKMLNGYFGALEADAQSYDADDQIRQTPQAGRLSPAADV